MADSSRTRRSGWPLGGFRVGKLFGVAVYLDWSLLIIFALIAVNLGAGVFPVWHPEWGLLLDWVVAVGAAALFLVSVLLHELSHALVARRQGISVPRITLFVFGGMAHMEGEPPSPKAEFLVAAVGPLVSIAIGVLATVAANVIAAFTLEGAFDEPQQVLRALGPTASLLIWLGPINILLGVFNLVPGFPLDGGRVFRAIVWGITKDLMRATRWAALSGQGFGWALMAAGVLMALGFQIPPFGRGPIQGLWLLLIGWFLSKAAAAGYQQLRLKHSLSGVSVRDIMRPNVLTALVDMSVAELVQEHVMRSEQRIYPVLQDGRLIGLVRFRDIRDVSHADRAQTSVQEIMVPLDDIELLHPDDAAMTAVQGLSRSEIDALPVVADGIFQGLVRQREIVKWMALHSDRGGARKRDQQGRRAA